MTERRRLRFFFEPGVPHTPLWPIDMDRSYGYPCDLERLPISPDLRTELTRLCETYQSSIDWKDPRNPSPWSDEQWQVFKRDVESAVEALRGELGDDWVVLDQSLL